MRSIAIGELRDVTQGERVACGRFHELLERFARGKILRFLSRRRTDVEPEQKGPNGARMVRSVALGNAAPVVTAVRGLARREGTKAVGGQKLALGDGENRRRLLRIEKARLDGQ